VRKGGEELHGASPTMMRRAASAAVPRISPGLFTAPEGLFISIQPQAMVVGRAQCRGAASSTAGSAGSTRRGPPCYGGDPRLQLGMEFKLTAADAQRALTKWTG
jgi:hypothetical protein